MFLIYTATIAFCGLWFNDDVSALTLPGKATAISALEILQRLYSKQGHPIGCPCGFIGMILRFRWFLSEECGGGIVVVDQSVECVLSIAGQSIAF